MQRSTRGFAYLLLLVTLGAIGAAAAYAVSVGAGVSRRHAEIELLAIGAEFERALRSHGASRIPAMGAAPRELDDLLLDRRLPGVRHLRKVYADPLTGRAQWGVVRHPDGSIAGIHSLANGQPIKRSGFGPQHASFENAERYGQWVFRAHP